MAERIRIASSVLTAEIAPLGAELQSLCDAQGCEIMSSGDPLFWSGRAPLLFPVVGRLENDEYRIDGRPYSMPKHGFARTSRFDIVTTSPGAALFRLCDDAVTRAAYPFAFELDAHFALDGATLTMTVTVRNTGATPLPASFGFHPAFAWPLPWGAARPDHRIRFETDESALLSALSTDGLIMHDARDTPVNGREIMLTDSLFTDDALIWKTISSRSLTYGPPEGAHLDIAFPDTEALGIWTKPGAAFICIEPWAGHADPEGYTGEFAQKPGIFTVPPGGERAFRMTVTHAA